MAEEKHPAKAATFKQTLKTNYETDTKKTGTKFSKLVPKELKFYQSPPNDIHRSFTPKEIIRNIRLTKPSRMLVYEDCSDEEESIRNTPPNIQDRSIFETPGAPMKSRKEFEKKVLRPKKLVYNDRENDAEDLGKENHFYHSTPKNQGEKEEGGDFYYEKLLNVTAIIPRKIVVPVRDNDSLTAGYSINEQRERESGRDQQDRNKSTNKGSRKKKLNNGARRTSSKSTSLKNDSTCNKENNGGQLSGTENDLGSGEFPIELSKNRSIKNTDRNREEFMNLSKIRELTHFRI